MEGNPRIILQYEDLTAGWDGNLGRWVGDPGLVTTLELVSQLVDNVPSEPDWPYAVAMRLIGDSPRTKMVKYEPAKSDLPPGTIY